MADESRFRERSRDLVLEVVKTALVVEDVMMGLLRDLPDGAFPGEDNAEVLLEMVVGSVMPAAAAAGERDVRAAIGLLEAIRERVLADLHTAAEMARESGGPDRPAEGKR